MVEAVFVELPSGEVLLDAFRAYPAFRKDKLMDGLNRQGDYKDESP